MPSNSNASHWDLLDSAAKTVRDRITTESRLDGLLNDAASPRGNEMNTALNVNSAPIDGKISLPYTQRLFWSAEKDQPQIGDIPPQPPTLRGRVGAVLVRMVQRMLFWYTGQLRAFHKAVSEAAGELAQTLRQLDAEQRRQRGLLSNTVERLDALERQLTDNQARELEDRSALTDRLNTLTNAVSTFGSQKVLYEQYIQELRNQQETFARYIAAAEQWRESDCLQRAHSSFEHRITHDALFVEHARSFRGGRTDIRNRLNVYVPYAKEAFVAAECAPALDLGCGRGEWLELLRDLGVAAIGIDWNRDLVNENREQGLDAIEGEILQMLRSLPDKSRSIITAFHVLEHLTFPDLLEIIDHTVRILKPGGIAVFETPNPGNLFVSTNNFYFDPTHQHPLPSEFLAFLVEARGLCKPKVIPLSPFPDYFQLKESDCPAVKFINDHFYGPQDYGIVALKG
jgi:O-antigen chain-terminating methyltransferase